jgi:hypothetical protein
VKRYAIFGTSTHLKENALGDFTLWYSHLEEINKAKIVLLAIDAAIKRDHETPGGISS